MVRTGDKHFQAEIRKELVLLVQPLNTRRGREKKKWILNCMVAFNPCWQAIIIVSENMKRKEKN